MIPKVFGTFPDMSGTIPEMFGEFPKVSGTIPEASGNIPESARSFNFNDLRRFGAVPVAGDAFWFAWQSSRGLVHSKTLRESGESPCRAQRLGVRRPSAAFPDGISNQRTRVMAESKETCSRNIRSQFIFSVVAPALASLAYGQEHCEALAAAVAMVAMAVAMAAATVEQAAEAVGIVVCLT